MIRPRTIAENGSTSIGGNNSGTITNVAIGDGANVELHFDGEAAHRLPSHLGNVIAHLASFGELAKSTDKRSLPPEVADKLSYNDLPPRHPVISAWTRHSLILERAYQGAEQQNPEARYLVLQRAGAVYQEELINMALDEKVPMSNLSDFARGRAFKLIAAVTERLLMDYRISITSALIELEAVRLSISLIVADAVIECEVLERPNHAIAP